MWKEKQITETEVFPPCNSEWQKKVGGRVWCTNKRFYIFLTNYKIVLVGESNEIG